MIKFNGITFNKNKRSIKKAITKLVLILFLGIVTPNIANNSTAKDYVPEVDKVEVFVPLSERTLDTIYGSLLNEIQAYINKVGPTSRLRPARLVDVCTKYDFDIMLAMAQAHVESHYGTKGIASRTNSVFNVGTFDDGTILYRYKDPNHSIEPYARLMTRNYLREKTAHDLLKPWSFVDFKGDRYATFIYYEYRVRNVYENIVDNTNIDELYELYTGEFYTESRQYYVNLDAITRMANKIPDYME